MADFDLDALLNARADAEAGAIPDFDPAAYAGAGTVEMAGSQKVYDLDGIAAAKKRNLEESFIGKVGINAETYLGDTVNTAASLVSGAGRLAGDTLNLPLNYGAEVQQASVSEEAIQAFNRMQAGTPEEGDEELLAAPSEISPDEVSIVSNKDRLLASQDLREMSKGVSDFFDWSSIVDTTRRDQLSADIKEDTAQGVELLRESGSAIERGDFLDAILPGAAGVVQSIAGAVPAAAQNPNAVAEYAAENLPQLLAAAKSVAAGAATNIGYAADQLREGYTDYAQEKAGQIPEQGDRIKMTAAAASLALAEQLGDLSVLRAARGQTGGNTASAVAVASAAEGITEGYQTWGEAQAHLGEASLEEIVEGATIGAAVGGTYTAAGRVPSNIKKATGRAAERVEQASGERAAVAAAQETGDIEPLINPESEVYNPAAAVTVLHKAVMTEDATPEVVQASLAQADSIEQELTKIVSTLEQNEAAYSEKNQANISKQLEQAEAMLASEDPAVDRPAVEQFITGLREQQEQAAARTPEEVQADQQMLKDYRAQLTSTRDAIKRMQVDASPSVEQVQEIATQVQEADPAIAQPAADKIMTLTMTNPDVVDLAQVQAAAADTTSGLSEPQRVALRSFGESQQAVNELKGMTGVSTDIETGGAGFKGLPQFRNAVRVALSAGNTEAAQAQVQQLGAFAQSRSAKYEAISTAYDAVKGTNNRVRLVRDSAGAWSEAPADMTPRQFKSAGGVTVDATSFKLRDAVGLEATALSRAAESLNAAVQAASVAQSQAAEPVATPAPAIASLDDALAMSEDEYVQAINPSGETNDEDGSAKLVRGDLADPVNGQVIKELPDGVTIERDEDGAFYARQGGDTLAEVNDQDGEVNISVLPEARGKGVAVSLFTEFMRENPGFDAGSLTPGGEAVVRAAYRRLQAEKVATPTAETDATVISEEAAPENANAAAPVDVAVTEATAPQTGELTAIRKAGDLRGKAVPSAEYKTTNLASAYYTQEAGKEDSATKRPLVAVPNFVTAVRDGLVKIADFLDTKTLTGQQKQAVNSFFGFQRLAAPIIQAGILRREGKRAEFNFRDQIQFLINEDGTIDENLSTAIAFAAYAWSNDSTGNLLNSDAGINAILGRDADEEIDPRARAKLATIGTRQAVVISQLGAKVAEVLGLQTVPNAPANERSRMEASLGAHAMRLLVESGLAVRKTLSDADLQQLMNSGVAPTKAIHFFVAPVSERVEGKLLPSELAQRYREANVGSQSVLNNLFGSQQGAVEPSFKPVKFTQSKAKRTQQQVPQKLAKILNDQGKRPSFLRQDMWQVWGNLSIDALYKISGVVDTTDVPTHQYNRMSREAKNDGLRTQVDRFAEFFGRIHEVSPEGLDQGLYFDHSVWKPQRVGLTANTINPQTSKVHRHMLRMDGWDTKVSFADQAAMDNFKLRVMEAFGVKTEAKRTVDVLADYEGKVGTPEVKAAVAALAEVLAGNANDVAANEQAILAGVAAGGENFHSLDALVALAQEKLARDSGAESFSTDMMGEVDGVTNGPMLSLLMLGAKGFETLNQGGFFSLEDQVNQFNDFHAEDGNLDLYESSIADVLRRLDDQPLLASIEVITGKLTDKEGNVSSKGRKIIKQPLTAMMFGSNTGTAVSSMADGFVASIYERMEEAYNAPARLKEVLTAVNALIASENANPRLQLPTTLSAEIALNTEYNTTQTEAIKAAFYTLLGQPTEEALNDTYTVFLARRNVINQSAGMAYELYEAAYETLREIELESADLPRNQVGEAFVDLTTEQRNAIQERLKDMAPILNTAFSKASNNLESGMLMAKNKRELNDTTPYVSDITFGQPVDYIDPNGSVANAAGLSANGLVSMTEGPGVAPLITSIHSTDSSISHTALDGQNVLNIHDAHGAGLNDVQAAGQRLNKATFNNMLNYSTAAEMVQTLERTVEGLAKLLTDPVVASRIQPKLKAAMEKKRVADGRQKTVEEQLESLRHVAKEADTAKLSMLANMRAVGQYATDGGSYLVTKADRDAASEALAKVGSDFSETAPEQAAVIDVFSKSAPMELVPVKAVPLSKNSVQTLAPSTTLNTFERVKLEGTEQIKQDVATVEQVMIKKNLPLASAKTVLPEERAADLVAAVDGATSAQRSVWGELGVPVTPSDAALVDLLTNSSDMTARGLAQALEANSTNPFNKKLLQAIARLVRQDLPVILVTAKTGPEGAMGEGVSKARGWYASRTGFDAMYIKSPEFVESGINEEMLTHELLHVVTGRVIQSSLDGKASPEVNQLVSELEALRVQAKSAIDASTSLSNKYTNAVSSVHELVSWGMTNAGFQEEVLKGLQVTPAAPNKLTTSALQKFIDLLTRLVFRGNAKNADRTGMGLLIANTSGLFIEAKLRMDQLNTLTLKYEDVVDDVDRMSTQEIFLALASNKRNSQVHQEHMSSLLDVIVAKLHGPMGAFRNEVAAGEALTTDDAFIKALDTDKFPFASKALASSFIVSPQEAFVLEQVEVTVAEAMESADTLFIRSSLERLWQEAKGKLSARSFFSGDWSQATQAERDIAQSKYDFLFRPDPSINGKSEVLSRFAALGLASEEVSVVLGFSTESAEQNLKGLSLISKLIELFRRVVTRLGRLHDKTRPGQVANHRLFTLVDRLVDIEAKRRGRIASRKVGMLDQVETALVQGGEAVRSTLDKVGQSAMFKSSSSPVVRLAGNAISTLATDRVDLVLDGISKIRDQAFREKQGVMMGILTEMRGMTELNKLAYSLFRAAKGNEVLRKQHIDYTVVQVNESFKDKGEYLTSDDKAALTRTLLRTNMGAVAAATSIDQVKDMIESPADMRQYRDGLEAQLKGNSNAAYYIGAVKDLAYNRVIGGNVSPNLMMNTQNIANLYGTHKRMTVPSSEVNAVVPVLDQLVALYAYEYAGSKDKALMKEVLRTEMARGQENGIAMLLKLHNGMLEQSKGMLFEGQETFMITGYTPDIFDTQIEVLSVNKADRAYYERRGYAFAGNMQEDAQAGLTADNLLMTRRGSGQIGILSGAFSYTGMQAKGSRVEREALNLLNDAPVSRKKMTSTIKNRIDADVRAMFNRPANYDPRQQRAQRVAPMLNPNGEVVDYRYMMTEHNRDSLLDRDSSMDQVLGNLAGQMVDKVSSDAQNTDVVRSMYDQYKADYANRPASYVQVGKDSTDPELHELYTLLPQRTKDEIRRVWKNDNMMIPTDQLNLVMGYRKYSLTTPFNKTDRSVVEQVYVDVVQAVLGEKAALRIGRAEDVVQELVKAAKDIIVVKNIFTLVGNIVSNITLLGIEGVSLTDAVRNTSVGIKGAMQYRSDNKRLIQLLRATDVGYVSGGDQTVQDEIAMLRDRIARNPVKPLIDAGLMPTIVEDVEVGENQYSYKSLLQKKVERFTDKIPKFARDVARNVYMTHDTGIYKFLSQTTQLSDFVSRYALYEHLINRPRDPLSRTDALEQTEEAFVNYDVPSHRTMQFLNDMGLFMFTKYYLRIQKVITRLVREKPARVLGMVLLNHYISGLQSVLDSSWLNKLGNNPFQSGPWAYPSALDELPAVKGLMNM